MFDESMIKKWDGAKAQVGMRVRWVLIGSLLFIVMLFVFKNMIPIEIDLLFHTFKWQAWILLPVIFLAGLIFGKISRFLSQKAALVEAKYRQRLHEDAPAGPPAPIQPA